MPKKAFFNLKEEKQEVIFTVAFEEFSKHQYMDASINKIVQNSGISRGSFYLYFEDKLDVYLFTTGKVMEKQSQLFLSKMLNKERSDVFKIFRELFLFNIHLLSDPMYSQYFKNLYLGMNYDIWRYIREKQGRLRENAYKQLDFNNQGDSSNEYTEALMSILEMINRDMLTKKIFEDLNCESVLRLYDIRIELLKKDGGREDE